MSAVEEAIATHNIEFSPKSVHTFELMNKRRFLIKTFRFKEFCKYFEVCVYDDETGEGEQRTPIDSHIKKIRTAIMDGDYTPTVFTVAAPSEMMGENTIHFEKLPLIDGGHRFSALCQIYEKEAALRPLIDKIPMPTMILIDSDTKKDFVNLQKGRAADQSQILLMNIRSQAFSEDHQKQYEFCRDVGRALNTKKGSPFNGYIKFDSKTSGKGASSFIKKDNGVMTFGGTYHVAKLFNTKPQQFVDVAVDVYNSITHTQAFQKGNFMYGEGVNRPFTMIVALMNIGFWARSRGYSPNWEYGMACLAIPKESSFSSNRRQNLLCDVVTNLFEDVECEKDQGVPEELLELFGHKSFGLKKTKKGCISFDAFMEGDDEDA